MQEEKHARGSKIALKSITSFSGSCLQGNFEVNEHHLNHCFTKELHTRPYMVTQKRCVWKKYSIGSNHNVPMYARLVRKLVMQGRHYHKSQRRVPVSSQKALMSFKNIKEKKNLDGVHRFRVSVDVNNVWPQEQRFSHQIWHCMSNKPTLDILWLK